MRYIVAVLISALISVECMPRPDGLSTPDVSAPTGLNGRDSAQVGADISDDGDVEIKQNKTTTSESKDETSKNDAQGYEHTEPDGEKVSQKSEKKTTHSESQKDEESESNEMKVGRGGLAMSEDKSKTSEKREENTKTGNQSYQQSNGDDPNHKHTDDSGSDYKNTNQSYDQHRDESHKKFAIGPGLETSDQSKSSSDKHAEQKTSEGSSHMRREDYNGDGNRIRRTGSASQGKYENESAKSSSNSTTTQEKKSSNGESEAGGTNGGADSEIGVGIDKIGDRTDRTDPETNDKTDAEVESRINDGADAGTDSGIDIGTKTETNGETDSGVGTNGGIDAGTDDLTNAGTDAGTGIGINSGTGAGRDVGINGGIDHETETGTFNLESAQIVQGDKRGQIEVENRANADQTRVDRDQMNAGDIGSSGDAQSQIDTSDNTQGQIATSGNIQSQIDKSGDTQAQIDASGDTQGQMDTAGNIQSQMDASGDTQAQMNASDDTQAQMNASGYTQGQMDTDGNRQGQMDASGDTQAQMDESGDTQAQIDASGDTQGQMDTAGNIQSQMDASGDTQAQIVASGDTQGQMDTDGNRQGQMDTAGNRQGQMDASGDTQAQMDASGDIQARMDASGNTQGQIDTADNIHARMDASGDTQGQKDTAGYIKSQMDASGDTQSQMDASGDTQAQMNASGDTHDQMDTAGNIQSQVDASGDTQGQRDTAGYIQSQMDASGDKQAQMDVSGDTQAQMNASGDTQDLMDPSGDTYDQMNTAVNIKSQMDASGDTQAQMNASGDTQGQRDTAGYIQSQIDARVDKQAQMDASGDTQGQMDKAGNIQSQMDASGDTQAQMDASDDTQAQMNASGDTQGQTDTAGNRQGQMDASGDTQGQMDTADIIQGQMDARGNTESQIGVQNDQRDGGDAEIEAGGQADANGLKFDVQKEVYRQLERDERALGLVRGGQPSTESVESRNRDFLKVKNDYLLAVAQNIHNARIVGDGQGHARILTPHRHSAESRYSTDFLNLKTPYRTLAQRFGFSPVSSHYANAQFVESRFGNMPSLFESDQEKRLNTGNTQYGGEKTHFTGKSQQGVRNLFERGDAKHGLNAANLQLNPLEWEEKARKDAELQNAQFDENKFMQSRFKSVDKIDPLVKHVILSQDLDDILGNVKTSAEVTSAIKTFGQSDKFFAINKQKELNNKNTEDALNKNEVFGHRKDKIVGKYNNRVTKLPATTHEAIYGGPKDISQVIINKVDLVSSGDRFDTSVISGNIMENTRDHPAYVHDGNVDGGENKVIYGSFENPRITSDRKSTVNGFKYVNMENTNSSPEVENDLKKTNGSNSSFDSKVNSRSKEITVKDSGKNSEDIYNATETNTEKNSEITSETTETELNMSSNDTATTNYSVETRYGTNQTIDNDSSFNVNEKNNSYTADAKSTEYRINSQFLSSTDEPVSDTSVDATPQVSTDNETEAESETENDKNNMADTFKSKSEVNTQGSARKSEVISADSASLSAINENLNITTDADKLNGETISKINKLNVTGSQGVNQEFEKDQVLKYNETNKTNINQTEFSRTDLSATNAESIDKEELKNNNKITIDETYTIKNDAKLNESVTNTSKVETKEESEIYTTEKSVDFNKPSFNEADIPADDDSVTVDSSNSQPELKSKSNVNSEDTPNITAIIDSTEATNNAKLANIDVNNDKSRLVNNTDVYNNSSNSNSDATVIETSTNTNVHETTATDKVNEGYETSERLFVRSAIESEEEYNIENATSIANGSNNTSATDLDKSTTLNSRTYNARREVDIGKVTSNSIQIPNFDTNITNANDISVTVNSTDVNDSLERTKHDISETVEDSNSDVNNITVANTSDVNATDSSDTTINTKSALETKTATNLNEHVTNDQDVTTIATYDKADNSTENSEATKTSDTSTDLNTIDIPPDGDKKPDSTVAGNKDESNISDKETVKSEANANSEVKENAGSSNYTPITAANTPSTTNVSTVNEATENRSVGGDNKTEKLTLVKPEKSQGTIKSNKSTMVKSDKFLTTVKSEREKEESKRGAEESTSKSEESSRSVSSERLIYTAGLDSASTSAE